MNIQNKFMKSLYHTVHFSKVRYKFTLQNLSFKFCEHDIIQNQTLGQVNRSLIEVSQKHLT